MDDEMKMYLAEINNMIGETWKGVAISAGITAGIFDELSINKPLSIDELAKAKKYDPTKLEKWFYYLENLGMVSCEKNKYKLTPKGNLFSNSSPFKDLLGIFQLTEFLMQTSVNSTENFRNNITQDKLSQGKLSTLYQPKVSDNISTAVIEQLKQFNLGKDDSLLDLGCGNGAFLRAFHSMMPEMTFTGVDLNLFAIEKGKKEIKSLGISEKIKLFSGDITQEMDEFADNAHDWVSAMNIFHFIPVHLRKTVIKNMLRICKKGIIFTESIIETSPVAAAGDAMLQLLWNDFTGLFKKKDAESLNSELEKTYKDFNMNISLITQGTSYLVIMLRK